MDIVDQMGQILLLFLRAVIWTFRPPFRWFLVVKQMEFVGVKSLPVVILTGTFSGGVFALQSYYGFNQFGAEGYVGPVVALALTRELGPVLTALMVTGRAGSAMAAELGTMRVTEQIDALTVMAANPVQYLVVPRIIAGLVMMPLLTIIADLLGIVGGYLVTVRLLGVDGGLYIAKTVEYLGVADVLNGLVKALVFGLIMSLIGCYKGYYTRGGAEGVGQATTQAVVFASLTIIISDYFLTAVMF
ncbi:MAG: ABC transporter permease [Proteobacteria bacterium]|nr:ABC transporter permease [Pseudomonadota bacterium]